MCSAGFPYRRIRLWWTGDTQTPSKSTRSCLTFDQRIAIPPQYIYVHTDILAVFHEYQPYINREEINNSRSVVGKANVHLISFTSALTEFWFWWTVKSWNSLSAFVFPKRFNLGTSNVRIISDLLEKKYPSQSLHFSAGNTE